VNEHQERPPSTIVMWAIAISAVVGVALLVGADVIADGAAAGHVRSHALSAVVVLAVAALIARRAAGSRPAVAPAIGLWLFAAAQLVEGVGGAGFVAANQTRNSLAVIHDLGIALTSVGLVAAVVGIAIGGWQALAHRRVPPIVAVGGSAAILGAGLFLVKTLVGF
jgi:hypothetical protein